MKNGLRKLRYNANLRKPKEAARKLNISESMLHKIESGEKKPSRDLIVRLSETYNCSIEDIFLSLNSTISGGKVI